MKKISVAIIWCICGLASAASAQQEVTVDQFTGTAQVTIPLTAAAIGGATVPVALGYAAKGLQADDKGGLVGAGWGLVGVPSLRREVRGLPDDAKPRTTTEANARYGWLTTEAQQQTSRIAAFTGFSAPYVPGASASALEIEAATLSARFEARNATTGVPGTMYDSEPDVYTYSVPGHAGRFVFDTQGNARTIPYDPISITLGYPAANTVAFDSLGYSISSFTLKTPEGLTYLFNQPDVMMRKTLDNPAFSQAQEMYFGRDYYYYKRPLGLKYPVAWNIAQASNLSGEQINFGYTNFFGDYSIALQRTAFRVAHAGAAQDKEYFWLLRGNQRLLTSIATPTATISFTLANNTTVFDNFLTGIEVTSSLLGASGVSRSIRFAYYTSRPVPLGDDRSWIDHYGDDILTNSTTGEFAGPTRRFLQSVTTSTACTRPLTYVFRYHHIIPSALTNDIPPPGTTRRDFWGNLRYDPDDASRNQAQLYAYSSTCAPQVVPGGPFRLYPFGNTTPPATLPGSDYRPASDAAFAIPGESNFQRSTLLGTLMEVKLPGGGRIQLAYEAHRFYDTKAQSATYATGVPYFGPGPRIRAITWLDEISATTQQREYSYTDASGVTSGRLLNWPVFGFLDPFASSGPITEAAAYSADALNSDPFEGRTVGYQYVTERAVNQIGVGGGRGRTVTTFAVPATADDVTATLLDGPAWQRTVIGLGRTNNATGTASSYVPGGNYLPGYSGYPLPLNTNLDHWRGVPLRVDVYNEPAAGSTTGTLAQRTDYQYKFWQKPTATGTPRPPVQGWAYEWVSSFTPVLVPCARYDLLTDFRVVVAQETHTLADQITAGRSQVSTAYYRYNDEGYVACRARRSSDGSGRRTSYKYLNDYRLPAAPAALPANPTDLEVLAYRCYRENLTAEPIEIIEETVPAGTTNVQLLQATLNTFIATPGGSAGTRTRPHKVLTWRQNTPVARSAYDSTQVTGSGSTAQWHIGTRYQPTQPEAVVEAVDGRLDNPSSVSSRLGRTIQGTHWSYNGYLPALQIANAYASEVRFSDFESTVTADRQYAWTTTLAASASARRTGGYGLSLTLGNTLETRLPVPAAGILTAPDAEACRLVAWVRGTQGNALRVRLAYGTSTPAYSQDFPVAATAVWQRVEVVLGAGIAPVDRPSYNLVLSAINGALDVDDVLVLPANATARSLTYDPTQGVSSETDERGRTTYYEYNGAGQLRTVRDQQQNIIRQNTSVLASQQTDRPAQVSFSVGGILKEGQVVSFNAPSMLCGAAITSYQWDFGCASSSCTTTNTTTAAPTCTYPVTSPVGFAPGQSYTVTLTITTSTGGSYTSTQVVQLARVLPPPIAQNACTQGPVTYYWCGGSPPGSIASCPPAVTPSPVFSSARYTTAFTVVPPPAAQACQPYTYQWAVILHRADGSWVTYADVTAEPNYNSPRVNPATAHSNRLEVANPSVAGTSTSDLLRNPESYYYCSITDNCGQRVAVADFLITVINDKPCP